MTTTVATALAPAGTVHSGAGRHSRRRSVVWLGLLPFAAYVLLFLAIPAVLAVASGFFDASGSFTLANFAAFANPQILGAFRSSIWISVVTAIVGAVVGALVCFALLPILPLVPTEITE